MYCGIRMANCGNKSDRPRSCLDSMILRICSYAGVSVNIRNILLQSGRDDIIWVHNVVIFPHIIILTASLRVCVCTSMPSERCNQHNSINRLADTVLIFFGHVHRLILSWSTTFRRPGLLPFSRKESTKYGGPVRFSYSQYQHKRLSGWFVAHPFHIDYRLHCRPICWFYCFLWCIFPLSL